MSRVLVVGGAGFIGSHLVEALVSGGDEVTVFDDLSNGMSKNLSSVCKAIDFKQLDIASAKRIGGEWEVIYNLACHPRSQSFSNPQRDLEVNVIGMVNTLECARKCGAIVVFTSNSGIYGLSRLPIDESCEDHPTTPYDLDKLTAERYLKLYKESYGVDFVIFRLGTVYGPRQRTSEEWKPVIAEFIGRIRKGQKPVIHGDGSQTRDFIYVSDVVDALAKSKQSEKALGETMILGTGLETSIRKLYEVVSALMHWKGGHLTGERPKGDIDRMVYDSSKARRILGWKPKVTLDEGIARMISYEKS